MRLTLFERLAADLLIAGMAISGPEAVIYDIQARATVHTSEAHGQSAQAHQEKVASTIETDYARQFSAWFAVDAGALALIGIYAASRPRSLKRDAENS